MAPVAPVMATINRWGVTVRSISKPLPTPEKDAWKNEGASLDAMPQNHAADPAPPAHGTCRVLQVNDAPLLIASGGPSELLGILQNFAVLQSFVMPEP